MDESSGRDVEVAVEPRRVVPARLAPVQEGRSPDGEEQLVGLEQGPDPIIGLDRNDPLLAEPPPRLVGGGLVGAGPARGGRFRAHVRGQQLARRLPAGRRRAVVHAVAAIHDPEDARGGSAPQPGWARRRTRIPLSVEPAGTDAQTRGRLSGSPDGGRGTAGYGSDHEWLQVRLEARPRPGVELRTGHHARTAPAGVPGADGETDRMTRRTLGPPRGRHSPGDDGHPGDRAREAGRARRGGAARGRRTGVPGGPDQGPALLRAVPELGQQPADAPGCHRDDHTRSRSPPSPSATPSQLARTPPTTRSAAPAPTRPARARSSRGGDPVASRRRHAEGLPDLRPERPPSVRVRRQHVQRLRAAARPQNAKTDTAGRLRQRPATSSSPRSG